MRHVYTVASFVLCVGLTACGGGQTGSSMPAVPVAANSIARNMSAQVALGSAHRRGAPADTTAATTYVAPLSWVSSSTTLLLQPQGACGYISATTGPGYSWPAFLQTLSAGTVVSVTGVMTYANAWSQQNGCPTGGISVTAVTLGNSTPAPAPSASPVAGYRYTAPWGYFTAWNTIAVRPQGTCRTHIAATSAAGFTWPQYLHSLASGPLVTLSGTPSYLTSTDKQNNCPTGGIVATGITLVSGAPAPSPSPSATPVSGPIPFGNVPPNYDPAGSWRPYNANSPWNQVLSENPTVDANSAAKMNWLNSSQFGGFDMGLPIMGMTVPYNAATAARQGGQYPFYFAKSSDPTVTIQCTAGYGANGSNSGCPLQNKQVHIPTGAQQAPNSDGHLILIQPDGTEIDAWTWGSNQSNGHKQAAPWYNGETVAIGWGGYTNVLTSSGFDEGSQGGSASAAGSDGLAGQIREPEMAAHQINHALRAETYCSPGSSVYPSSTYGGSSYCNGAPTSGSAVVPMGSRIWLSASIATINSYPIPEHEKTIMRALHQYGAYVTDNNNYTGLAFNGMETPESGAVYGNDIVDAWVQANLNSGGGNYYFSINSADFNRYMAPYLRVLAPCATIGFPGGQC